MTTNASFSLPRSLALVLLLAWLLVLLGGCGQLDLSMGPLLYDVRVAPDFITPNADGNQDVTEIRYSLRRSATVSIYFENEAGQRFYFRQERRRSPGDYSVQWGGVVDEPRTVETDYGTQEILSQVLPDGRYRWVIQAVEDNGQQATVTGEITLQDADTRLPELHNFAVVPQVFTPNQDGIDDRVSISYYLTKDVESVLVYLVDPAEPDIRYFLAESPSVAKPTEQGYHSYDYDGGVDLNAEPPPDGVYQVVGEARDRAGNAVRVISQLTIREGGKPRADVAQGEIDWVGEMNRQVSIPLGEKLCFRAVVRNEGVVPIRTTGPQPGQEYRFSENYNTLAAQGHKEWYKQAGAWRFGINFETSGTDFPFRWAIGRPEDLERRVIDGQEQWYLLPGQAGEVSGCIIMDEPPPLAATLWWGGLIHEDVAVVNNYIDRIWVEVGVP
ncbi:MAG: hypothetical protein KatS3mg050_1295 [Litorilinea sp.]|nr:MAG: hypothetical protein KatS3mg050_1295 [Litorilinea sp.]